jgi:hypothetical protein
MCRIAQRLVLMGRIAHKIPTVMKRRLGTKALEPPPNILGGVGKFQRSKPKTHHSVTAGWYCDMPVGEHDL